jgi:predicted ester cyclase
MHWVFSGTHEGELYGVPPTGKKVSFQNISISRVEDGRIVQYNSEIGFLSVLMQLGVLPLSEKIPASSH